MDDTTRVDPTDAPSQGGAAVSDLGTWGNQGSETGGGAPDEDRGADDEGDDAPEPDAPEPTDPNTEPEPSGSGEADTAGRDNPPANPDPSEPDRPQIDATVTASLVDEGGRMTINGVDAPWTLVTAPKHGTVQTTDAAVRLREGESSQHRLVYVHDGSETTSDTLAVETADGSSVRIVVPIEPTNDPPANDPPANDPPANDPPANDPPVNDPPVNEATTFDWEMDPADCPNPRYRIVFGESRQLGRMIELRAVIGRAVSGLDEDRLDIIQRSEDGRRSILVLDDYFQTYPSQDEKSISKNAFQQTVDRTQKFGEKIVEDVNNLGAASGLSSVDPYPVVRCYGTQNPELNR